MLKDAIDLSRVRRALVIKLRHHGDVLLASPVFSCLKARLPDVEIDALVYADTAEMLTLNPSIAAVHVIDRAWKSLQPWQRLTEELKLLRALRSRRYDLIVHLSEHPRGAWLSRFLGVAHAVAPDYQGRSSWWRGSFSHRFAMAKNPRRHMVEWNLDSLRRIGIQPPPGERGLCLVPGASAEARVAGLLEANGLSSQSFVHVHPASRWQFKCWPATSMARLIDGIQQNGTRVVLTAAPSPEERSLVNGILDHVARPPVDLSGQLSLKEVAEVARRARLFVGVDSAPMHMAAAVGTPVVALFGPSGDQEWGPWDVSHRVVASTSHPCRPCGNDGCGGSKVSDCLVNLPVKQVLDAVRDLLPA